VNAVVVRRFWALVFAAMAVLAVGCEDPDPCDGPPSNPCVGVPTTENPSGN